MLKIVGLGPGNKDALTIGTLEALKASNKVLLRTYKHPNVDYLRELGIEFTTYDEKYDSSDSFDEVYSSIAEELMLEQREHKDIVYAVPGHPLVAEKSVSNVIKLCEEQGVEYEIYPAVSFIDVIIERLKLDPVNGLKIIDAFDIQNQLLDKRIGTIITQVYNNYIASEVKLALTEYYKDDTEIYFVRAAGVKGMETIRKIPLYELDRQEDIDHLTSVYIPKDLNNTYDFHDFLGIMDTLRGENGCPWDKKQTHESLKRYLIEECYEVLEAIDEEDEDKLVEELGDVLLQVVFHARIGKEEDFFNMGDVIKRVSRKMIERHPHIFGSVKAETAEDVLTNWDAIKKEEKGYESITEELKHIGKNLPALMRAEKVQMKAKKAGFDWDKVEDALNKISEEYEEVKNVYKGENRARILEELGDLLFSTVNVCRFLDIEPENALNYTIEKFIVRFEYIEQAALSKGMQVTEMTLEQMDALWEEAKCRNKMS